METPKDVPIDQIVKGLERRIRLLEGALDGARVPANSMSFIADVKFPKMSELRDTLAAHGWTWLYLCMAAIDLLAFGFFRDWLLLAAAGSLLAMAWLSWSEV